MNTPEQQNGYYWLWITGIVAITAGLLSPEVTSAISDFFRGVAVGIGMGAIILGFWLWIVENRKSR